MPVRLDPFIQNGLQLKIVVLVSVIHVCKIWRFPVVSQLFLGRITPKSPLILDSETAL